MATRPAISRLAHRPFVCQTCRDRLQGQTARPRRHALQFRPVSSTSSRRADVVPAEKEEDDPYLPADNWEGLEWVGSKEWLYARDSQRVDHERYGAQSPPPSAEAETLRLSLRRAIIEALALKAANVSDAKKREILEATKGEDIATAGVGVEISGETGAAELVYRDPGVRKQLHEQLRIDSPNEAPSTTVTLTTEQELNWANVKFASASDDWFAIFKRVAQLSGIPIPDAAISNSSTPRQVLSILERKPVQQTVLQALAADKRLAGLNNVTVYGRRQTYVDKDRTKGRWKIIEQELVERGLPLPKRIQWARRMNERRQAEMEQKRLKAPLGEREGPADIEEAT